MWPASSRMARNVVAQVVIRRIDDRPEAIDDGNENDNHKCLSKPFWPRPIGGLHLAAGYGRFVSLGVCLKCAVVSRCADK